MMTTILETEEKQAGPLSPPRISIMDMLLKSTPIPLPKANDLIEGLVLGQSREVLFIDLSPIGTGIIYGQEYNRAKDIVKELNTGDKVTVKITEMENERGYISLSFREAKQKLTWREAENFQKSREPLTLLVKDANKGGLMLDWNGLQGFLPTSQLKSNHYPRIQDGDKDKIEIELRKLIGEKIKVVVISSDPKENKLIFSEKGNDMEEIKKVVSSYKVGDIVEGTITGIVDFGVFIKIANELEGLAHISELDWSLVEKPSIHFKVGEKVNAQIINIMDGKISLSLKALKPDPWSETKDKYLKGNIVKGVVIKFNKHGALASVEEGVAGLVHISCFKSEIEMRKKIELGKSYNFQITNFEPKEHKLTLVYVE